MVERADAPPAPPPDPRVVYGARSWVRRRVTARSFTPPEAGVEASAEHTAVDGTCAIHLGYTDGRSITISMDELKLAATAAVG